MSVTPELLDALAKPFRADVVKWKIQTKPGNDDKCLVVAYLDARDVAERLDRATGGVWTESYTMEGIPQSAHEVALQCTITIDGISRTDVGTTDVTKSGQWDVKELFSDAFKRAAVKWGIGRFLYRLPVVRADFEGSKDYPRIAQKAAKELEALTDALLNEQRPPRCTYIQVFGVYQEPDIPPVEEPVNHLPQAQESRQKLPKTVGEIIAQGLWEPLLASFGVTEKQALRAMKLKDIIEIRKETPSRKLKDILEGIVLDRQNGLVDGEDDVPPHLSDETIFVLVSQLTDMDIADVDEHIAGPAVYSYLKAPTPWHDLTLDDRAAIIEGLSNELDSKLKAKGI